MLKKGVPLRIRIDCNYFPDQVNVKILFIQWEIFKLEEERWNVKNITFIMVKIFIVYSFHTRSTRELTYLYRLRFTVLKTIVQRWIQNYILKIVYRSGPRLYPLRLYLNSYLLFSYNFTRIGYSIYVHNRHKCSWNPWHPLGQNGWVLRDTRDWSPKSWKLNDLFVTSSLWKWYSDFLPVTWRFF